jgi:HlyD family secretion protein
MALAKKKSRKKFIVFGLILLVIGGLSAAAIMKKKEAAITVQTEKAARRDVTELVVANGKIQPVLQVKISPEVSGEIVELPFKEGQNVKKGDLLVAIRPDNYVAARDSSRANYNYSVANSNTAYANLVKADLEYKRNDNLHQHNLISDSDYLTAKTAYDVAIANLDAVSQQVQMASASLHSSESDLSKTKIFSPIDGRITKLSSQLGERVVGTAMMAGTEILTVSDLDQMEARVDIGEIDVVLIAVGQKVRLEVDAFKDRKFEGVVTDVANSAKNNDPSGLTSSSSSSTDATKFQVKIRIKEKEIFLPGMSVTAEIETRSRTNPVTVPIQCVAMRLPKAAGTNSSDVTAVKADPKDPTNTVSTAVATNKNEASGKSKPGEAQKPVEVVFLMEDGRAKMVPVKRGIGDDKYYEILEGVKEGDVVITGPYKAVNRELEDGKLIVVGGAKTETASKP